MMDHDIILPGPFPPAALRWVLFFVFEVHLMFALFTVGLALIGSLELLRGKSSVRAFSSFTTQKSLAVVIGVGALILFLVLHPVPMLRGVNRIAPGWLLLVLLLMVALVSIELAAHLHHAPARKRILAIIGCLALLSVAAIFSNMVVTVENPGVWPAVSGALPPWPPHLIGHYLVRWLHVLGASVVLAAGWLLVAGRPPLPQAKRLVRWLIAALWFQVLAGVALFELLPRAPGIPALISLFVALLALAILASRVSMARAAERLTSLERRPIILWLALLLTGMLLTRQFLQNQVLVPIGRDLRAKAVRYQAKIQQGVAHSFQGLPVYSKPAVIYAQSCSFCHGGVANGQGTEAPRLRVPPEDLTAVRASNQYLYKILRGGVPGTAMPRFNYYTRGELDHLISFLRTMGAGERLEPNPQVLTQTALTQARRIFRNTCSQCHGFDGSGHPGASLQPPPPNLTRYSLAPARAFEIISTGYPGTVMQSYGSLPPEVRQALVYVVRSFYEPVPAGSGL